MPIAPVALRRAWLLDDRVVVAYPFDPVLLASLRRVAGRKRFNGPRREWHIDIDEALDRPALRTWLASNAFAVDGPVWDAIAGGGAVAPLPARRVAVEHGAIIARFPYDERLSTACAALGGRFHRSSRTWQLPLTVEVATAMRDASIWHDVHGVDTIAGAVEALAQARTAAVRASMRAAGSMQFAWLTSDDTQPMPFQRAGVEIMVDRETSLLADQPGLGKTIQALLWLAACNLRGAVVVVPTVVALNWAREAKVWLPRDWRVVVMTSGVLPVGWDRADLVVVPVSRIDQAMGAQKIKVPVPGRKTPRVEWQFKTSGRVLLARQWSAVIGDEAHMFKTRTADRTACMAKLAASVSRVALLTGTPMLNRPSELVMILTMLRVIDQFGGAFAFLKRYCDGKQTTYGWDFTGASHLDELNQRLRETVMVRRLKAEVLKDLPTKFTPRRVSLALGNRDEYDRADQDVAAWMAENLGAVESGGSAGAQALVRITALRQLVARGKLAAAIEWIRDTLTNEGAPVIIFAKYIEIQKALARAFPHCATVFGDMDSTERQAQIDRFQRDKATDVMVTSIGAGGVGWTGTRASDVVFLELEWTPSAHEQAEDRAHRIGQTRAVTPWYLTADDSIDDVLWGILADKARTVARGVDGTDASAFQTEDTQSTGFAEVVRRMADRQASPRQNAANP